jgi:hypothetical protein
VREEWGIVELHCSAVLWRACIWVETRSSPSVTAPPPVKSFQSSAAGIHQPFPFDSELGRLLLLFLDTGFASPTPLAFFAGTRLESRGSTVARTSYLILALYCVIDGDVPSGAEPETDDTHIKRGGGLAGYTPVAAVFARPREAHEAAGRTSSSSSRRSASESSSSSRG